MYEYLTVNIYLEIFNVMNPHVIFFWQRTEMTAFYETDRCDLPRVQEFEAKDDQMTLEVRRCLVFPQAGLKKDVHISHTFFGSISQ